jgi:hypothetical protein
MRSVLAARAAGSTPYLRSAGFPFLAVEYVAVQVAQGLISGLVAPKRKH